MTSSAKPKKNNNSNVVAESRTAAKENSRGIPKAVFIKNPYEIVYRNQAQRYMQEVQQVLSKYTLMEQQLVKQKMTKVQQNAEMKQNIQVCEYLQSVKNDASKNSVNLHFEVADNLYSEGNITNFDNVSLWLGANVMMEFPVNEAILFLQKRLAFTQSKIDELQMDINYTRKQINVIEVNRSRVYNATVKIKKARDQQTQVLSSNAAK